MTALFLFLAFLAAQRLFELSVAKRHERILRMKGAVEVDARGYRYIVLMHSAWFASMIVEFVFLKRSIDPYWPVILAIFAAAQVLRYWAISSLGAYWNTKILVAPNHPLIRKGPYRFIRHPNYVAVIAEIAVVPLIFSCYTTATFFSVLNAIVLRRRVRLEMKALTGRDRKVEKMPDGITT